VSTTTLTPIGVPSSKYFKSPKKPHGNAGSGDFETWNRKSGKKIPVPSILKLF
jgi:hypothetical protein